MSFNGTVLENSMTLEELDGTLLPSMAKAYNAANGTDWEIKASVKDYAAAFFPRREKDNREENAARTGWHRRRFAVACKRAGNPPTPFVRNSVPW